MPPEPERTSQPPPDEPFPRFTALRFKTAHDYRSAVNYFSRCTNTNKRKGRCKGGRRRRGEGGRNARLTSSGDDDLTENTTANIVRFAYSSSIGDKSPSRYKTWLTKIISSQSLLVDISRVEISSRGNYCSLDVIFPVLYSWFPCKFPRVLKLASLDIPIEFL